MDHALRIGMALIALASGVQASDRPEADLPDFERPYVVTIELQWDQSPALGQAVRSQIVTSLSELANRTTGLHWKIRFLNVPLPAASLDTLDRWTPPPAADQDKHFLVGIRSQGSGFELAGSEWDVPVASRSRTVRRTADEPDEIPRVIWQIVRDCYRPVAAVHALRSGELQLRIRGVDLSPPDPEWQPAVASSYWLPVNRHLAADQTLQRLQPIPWTYIRLKTGACCSWPIEVVSGLRSPLRGRRRRLETLALRISSSALQPTRLHLRNRNSGSRPMAGLEVRLMADEKTIRETLVTDRRGAVTIPPPPDVEPQWLQVFSGQELLARVPFVAGLQAEEVLDLPDDTVRLRVEGEITLLQADLIDTVARRATLLATARRRAREGHVTGVQEALRELGTMKPADEFVTRLAAIRLNGTQSAREQKNRVAEARIVRMCDETSALITAYLSPDKLKQLEEEIAELKETAADLREERLLRNPSPKKP